MSLKVSTFADMEENILLKINELPPLKENETLKDSMPKLAEFIKTVLKEYGKKDYTREDIDKDVERILKFFSFWSYCVFKGKHPDYVEKDLIEKGLAPELLAYSLDACSTEFTDMWLVACWIRFFLETQVYWAYNETTNPQKELLEIGKALMVGNPRKLTIDGANPYETSNPAIFDWLSTCIALALRMGCVPNEDKTELVGTKNELNDTAKRYFFKELMTKFVDTCPKIDSIRKEREEEYFKAHKKHLWVTTDTADIVMMMMYVVGFADSKAYELGRRYWNSIKPSSKQKKDLPELSLMIDLMDGLDEPFKKTLSNKVDNFNVMGALL